MRVHTPDLLHNWAPPETILNWDAPAQRLFGFGVVIALPGNCQAARPSQLMQLLEGRNRLTGKAAEAELHRRIQIRAVELPLPAVAGVTAQSRDGDTECTDLLTIMTVLAKSSSRVYLRDKEPNLAAILPGRRLVLVVAKEVTL